MGLLFAGEENEGNPSGMDVYTIANRIYSAPWYQYGWLKTRSGLAIPAFEGPETLTHIGVSAPRRVSKPITIPKLVRSSMAAPNQPVSRIQQSRPFRDDDFPTLFAGWSVLGYGREGPYSTPTPPDGTLKKVLLSPEWVTDISGGHADYTNRIYLYLGHREDPRGQLIKGVSNSGLSDDRLEALAYGVFTGMGGFGVRIEFCDRSDPAGQYCYGIGTTRDGRWTYYPPTPSGVSNLTSALVGFAGEEVSGSDSWVPIKYYLFYGP